MSFTPYDRFVRAAFVGRFHRATENAFVPLESGLSPLGTRPASEPKMQERDRKRT